MNVKTIITLAAMAGTAMAYAMKPNDTIHNFTVDSVIELPEVPGRLWRMTYRKNGAELAWLERDDENKTFAVAFKTVPENDTGIAHIMEHSVLCGSEKYPVKEPFVDLLKSSLATFLNAMTYPDKTVYPVASRNNTDFLNLIDVYMDAVLHPLSVKNRMALDQEGWHYEFDESGKLIRNGVVYSEMKGVFSNPDSVAFWETMKLLFPDTCYSHESGGDPDHIPELTFEEYKAFHARFYHPSNARFFLDGKVDVAAVLEKLDSFLKDYERIDVKAEIPMQSPVESKATVGYEVADDGKDKYILVDGWVIGRFDEREKQVAFTVLADVLAGSNEAPLKKALLDRGLCEDVEIGAESVQQIAAMLTIRNTSKENAEQCRKVVRETLEKLAKEGLDRKRIEAILNKCEFLVREKDSGSYPRGLGFLEAALEGWMYGADPSEGFRYKKVFESLRAKIATGGFEQYLKEMLIDNPHHAELTLEPSATIGEERRKKDAEELAKILSGWDEKKIAEVKEAAAKLKEYQKSKDRPEDAAKLPKLLVKDIPVKGEEIRIEKTDVDGCAVLRPKVGADGIFYLELYFSLADLNAQELLEIPFFTTLLGELATENFGALELKSEIDANLGRFSIGTKVYDAKDTATAYVSVQISALESKWGDALRIAKEVLLGTKFTDAKAAGDLLKQVRQDMEQGVAVSGNQYAMRRAGARLSRANEMDELTSGIAQLRWLQKAGADAELLGRYAALAGKIFTSSRLTLCISDNM
ncbi:MAG: insulinase family protein, partial [Kiritimatiellae bacterium]|nr:insulinase family protein [Kiritimatiellia bacterium]